VTAASETRWSDLPAFARDARLAVQWLWNYEPLAGVSAPDEAMSRTSPMKTLAALIGAAVAVGLGVSLWTDRGESGLVPVRSALSMASGVRMPPKGREIMLELFNEGLEDQLTSIATALGSSVTSIDSLTLRGFPPALGDAGLMRVIERHPDLAPSKLSLTSIGMTPRGLAALLRSQVVSRLEVLDLQDNLLGVGGAKLLAESTRLATLVELNLARNYLHEDGAIALAHARGLRNLKRLELGYNFIGPKGAQAFAQSSALPQLEDLGLAYNFLKNEGALNVSRVRWPALVTLDLRSNEIERGGATALVESKTLVDHVTLWLGSNPLGAMADAGAPERVLLDGGPATNRLAGLGRGGEESFELSRRGALSASTAPPASLPSTVEFRELWIWEFGFVADFPTFMTPDRVPGNGKSRTFTWLDRAELSIGGYWPLEQTLAGIIAEQLKSASKGRPTVERKSSKIAIVRHAAPGRTTIQRLELDGALLYVDLSYDDELAPYFAPIVDRVIGSTYFDRKHLEERVAR
jgi:hypothetical protein